MPHDNTGGFCIISAADRLYSGKGNRIFIRSLSPK
jgi:hypothetical protein